MGTFILRATDVFINTDWDVVIGGIPDDTPSNVQLLEAVNFDGVVVDTYLNRPTSGAAENATVTFLCTGSSIYLDGSPTPIDINSLPAGFTVVTAFAKSNGSIPAPLGAGVITFKVSGSAVGTITIPDTSINVDLMPFNTAELITTSLGVDAVMPDGSEALVWNYRLEGTYSITSGFSLNPPSGDVEPGQTIIVTGPGAGTIPYGILNNPKVIPVTPKVINPTTVKIEVPKPPTDPCFDCLSGSCPECDDCFDPCSEDLESEECQSCLDACLDCLVNCLEDLEAAEECQKSTQDDPPDEVPIVVICNIPFGGSVPLGTFNILVAEASGIYQLVDGKTNDTLYATARDGTTYDVKIPDPNGKTGFFRS